MINKNSHFLETPSKEGKACVRILNFNQKDRIRTVQTWDIYCVKLYELQSSLS